MWEHLPIEGFESLDYWSKQPTPTPSWAERLLAAFERWLKA